MNRLLDKFYEYKTITNYCVEYTFEDDTVVRFKLKQTDFPHLIGLHKLIDIPVIRQFNDRSNSTVSAKYIISKIKKQQLLTEDSVKKSIFFQVLQNALRDLVKKTFLRFPIRML